MLAAIASIATAIVGVATNIAVGSGTSVVAVLVLLLAIGGAAYLEASRERLDVDAPNAASESEVKKRRSSRRRLLLAATIPITLTLGYLPIAAFNDIWPWNAGASLNAALDPVDALSDILLAAPDNNLELHVSYERNDAFVWGKIQRAGHGDRLSVERSFDGGNNREVMDTVLIISGKEGWSTKMYPLGISTATPGRGRACLTTADKTKYHCTPWLPVCKPRVICDGQTESTPSDAALVSSAEKGAGALKVDLYLSLKSRTAQGVVIGERGAVWLDRRFLNAADDSHNTMDNLLGLRIHKTHRYLIDDPIRGKAEVRACAGNGMGEIICTEWKSL